MYFVEREGPTQAAARRPRNPLLRRLTPSRGVSLLLACLLLTAARAAPADLPAPALVPGAAVGCTELYSDDDPRLFDFIETRRAVDYRQYQGLPIRAISHVTLPIFNPGDPRENNALYRSINHLHILTRQGPIHRQLLVHVGDPIVDDLIRESERILRGANYLYDAMILPTRVCDDGIDLLVVVRDIWTLQPTASFKRAGGESSTSLGISDDNILGYGHGINLSYDRDAQRSGIALSYNSRNLLDGHTRLEVGHSKNDDGRTDDVALTRPFYALDTRWSAGISASDDIRRETVATGGITTNDYEHQSRDGEVFLGYSRGLQSGVVKRWRFGVTHARDRFDRQDPAYAVPLPDDRLLAFPWVEFERLENDFMTTSNLAQMFRNEDINVGEGWRVRAGATSSILGSTIDALVTEVAYSNTMSLGTHHLLRNGVLADIYWEENRKEYENTIVSITTSYDYFIDDNNRWHATLGLDAGINLPEDNLLGAGGDSNLRGYPSHWQRGNRRAVTTLERRHFFGAHPLNLFRLGAAAFVEAGQAWDSTDTIVQSGQVLADVGIGLRINSSKARPDHVLHIDLAFPLTDRNEVDGFQLSVQADNSF